MEKARFRAGPYPHSEQDLRAFWPAVCVDADKLDALVQVDPWFSEGHLWLSPEVEARKDPVNHICNMQNIPLQVSQHTQTPGGFSVGRSCVVLVAACCDGLRDIMRMTRAEHLPS